MGESLGAATAERDAYVCEIHQTYLFKQTFNIPGHNDVSLVWYADPHASDRIAKLAKIIESTKFGLSSTAL